MKSRWRYGSAAIAAAGLASGLLAGGQVPGVLQPWQWFGSHAPATATATSAGAAPAAAAGSGAAVRQDYVIGAGDVLDIDVWKQPEISRTLPVRPDGRITLPLVGAIQASGRTPAQLQDSIAAKLTAYVSTPVVTVMVAKVESRRFSVLGAVLRPGAYPLPGPTRMLEALAQAGGFTPFANPDRIELLREESDGHLQKLSFNYSAVVQGRDVDQDRLLQPGDTIVVP